jgi:multiple antibiotic resistance protein
MRDFLLAFIPLFVAVDAVGVLPIFLGLTDKVDTTRRRSIILQSVITAATVAIVFTLAGRPLLRLLGISASDFMISGGVLLFVLSLNDLLSVGKPHHKIDPDTVGAVPIGVPLITGPAVLTTCMLLVDQYSVAPTISAAILNVLIAGVVFWFATPISRALGSAGTKTLSKIASLLLASIAVMMVRKGLVVIIMQMQSGV